MKAIILAAGEGSRMRPLTYTRPKVMLPLVNKPISEHLLIAASEAGIKELIFIVGYRDEQVRNYFSDGSRWGVSIKYAMQMRQLGTADALRMVSGLTDGNFLVMNGDVVIKREDIERLSHGKESTMAVYEVENTKGLGVVEVKGNRIVHIHEKADNPPSKTANTGVYLFTPDIFEAISRISKSKRGEYELTDALQMLIDKSHGLAFYKLGYWLDISYPWDLLPANESMLKNVESKNLGEIENNVTIKGILSVGKGTLIRSGAYISGPVVIGENCEIGPNCYIRPNTVIGNNCHIGASVEVKNSLIMNGSKIPHHNYIGDSVIGEGCNFGAGTKIANLRLDKKDITAAGINTGRRKLGAIIGDNVEIGINACINVGSIIGNNARIGPGAIVSGLIMPESRLY